MREKKLSDKMKKEAVGLGLCRQWTEEWGEKATRDEMVDKFVRGLDFCIEHDWPSTEVMKREFGDVMHRHGVWVDEAVRLGNPDTVVMNGSCDGVITADRFAVSNIYVRHKSKLRLRVSDRAYVHVSVYDGASVEIKCEGAAKCFVYRYGGKVKTEGKVVVRERGGEGE